MSSAFSPYPAQNGTYGALIQLDEHGRVVLDTLSVERRGGFLFVFINGRPITELQIDKRVSDGKIYIPSGLTAADIDLMKKDWRSIGQAKTSTALINHAIIRCRNCRSFFSRQFSMRVQTALSQDSRSCSANGQ